MGGPAAESAAGPPCPGSGPTGDFLETPAAANRTPVAPLAIPGGAIPAAGRRLAAGQGDRLVTWSGSGLG